MKLSNLASMLLAIGAAIAFAQVQPNEPTKEEIAEAYRSKSGGGGTIIPRVQWGRWRIQEIRGWKLHFKRIGQKHSPGLMTLEYEVIAKKSYSCAAYQITDTMPFPPNNVQLKPLLVVDSNGVEACR